MSWPAFRFLLKGLYEDASVSPSPDNPLIVIGFAPAFVAIFTISLKAILINAPFRLFPKFSPSHIPAPMVTIFLSAPPNSTPVISSLK